VDDPAMTDTTAGRDADAAAAPWWGRLAPPAEHGPLPVLLLGATLLTGVVDAVSYIALGHVFVANMTGNVVLLGFALAGAPGLSVVASLVALAAFLAGAALGGLLTRRIAHRGALLRTAAGAEAALLAVGLLGALGAPEPVDGARRALVVVAVALAMGVQTAAARRIAVPDLATTVLTLTLAALAVGVTGSGAGPAAAARRAGAVVAMFAGALAGGLLTVRASPAAGMALALAVALAIALAAQATAGSRAPWAAP
jgi:uncharacterized membrane protein YoaK (UPF0700 family)